MQVSSLTRYNIAPHSSNFGMLVACMQLQLRTSLYACPSTPKQPLFQYSIDMTSVHELVAGDQGESGSQAEVCSLGLAPRPLLLCYTVYWAEAPFKQGTSCSSNLGLAEMEHNVHLLLHHLICRQAAALGFTLSHSLLPCFLHFACHLG